MDIKNVVKTLRNMEGDIAEVIAKNGLAVIALPQNIDRIPQWIIDIADIASMAHDNVSKFNPVLISLGIVPLQSKANMVHMSNIVNL